MKLKIISDIKKGKENIIVYGLKLARYLEWEVDIIHMVDPRAEHGVASTYSDSQTITPGRKMTPDEIIQREINENQSALDNLISGEGSRLDYPLKINSVVEEGAINAKLRKIGQDEDTGLIMVNSELDNNVLSSRRELFDLMKSIPAAWLIVPSGHQFHSFNHMMLPAEFLELDSPQYPKISFILKHFNSRIEAVDVVKKTTGELDKKTASWIENARNIFTASTLEAKELEGVDYNKTLIEYVKKTRPDLLLLLKKEKSIFERLFKKDLLKDLIEKTNLPLLFYNSH